MTELVLRRVVTPKGFLVTVTAILLVLIVLDVL